MNDEQNIPKKRALRPQRLFLFTAFGTVIVAAVYYLFFPYAYFDLSVNRYFIISSYFLWLIFSAYLFLLATIYYVASRGKLRSRNRLVTVHYIFVLLFLVTFFGFSLFNENYVRELLSNFSMSMVFLVYGLLFLLDMVLFFTGLIFLVANILDFRKR